MISRTEEEPRPEAAAVPMAQLAANLDLSKRVLQSCSTSSLVLTALYTRIQRLLEMLIEGNNVTPLLSTSTREAFAWLLFGPSPDAVASNTTTPERVRLLRAEALLAFANALRLAGVSDPTALDHFTTLESLEPSVQVRQHLSRGRQLLLQRPDQAVPSV